jgi:hypothetical protein
MWATHGADMLWGFARWKELVEANAFIHTDTFLVKRNGVNILNFTIYCFYDNIHFVPCQYR